VVFIPATSTAGRWSFNLQQGLADRLQDSDFTSCSPAVGGFAAAGRDCTVPPSLS
jgi:hypothetical protein